MIHFVTAPQPLFDRHLFANVNFVVSLLFMVVIGMVMFATMALLPPMLQGLFGYDVIDTGMVLMPRGVGVLVSMQISGLLMRKGVDARWMVSLGFLVGAWSLWQMAGWSLEVDRYNLVLSGLIQGLGIGLVFIPLNATAFATLPPQLRTDGSSLLNLTRSVGSSIGISIMMTLLSRNTQTSHSDLAGHITPTITSMIDLSSLERFQQYGEAGLGMLDLMVTRQAAMVAYVDDFWLMMWLSLAAVPLVLLMRSSADPAVAPGRVDSRPWRCHPQRRRGTGQSTRRTTRRSSGRRSPGSPGGSCRCCSPATSSPSSTGSTSASPSCRWRASSSSATRSTASAPGIFFIGYFLFEVPSNLVLTRVGARKWMARIMISWGLISAAFVFVDDMRWGPVAAALGCSDAEFTFYVLRFLLGAAEAGFFPGVILYLTFWFPARPAGAGGRAVHDRDRGLERGRLAAVGRDPAIRGRRRRAARVAMAVRDRGAAVDRARVAVPRRAARRPAQRALAERRAARAGDRAPRGRRGGQAGRAPHRPRGLRRLARVGVRGGLFLHRRVPLRGQFLDADDRPGDGHRHRRLPPGRPAQHDPVGLHDRRASRLGVPFGPHRRAPLACVSGCSSRCAGLVVLAAAGQSVVLSMVGLTLVTVGTGCALVTFWSLPPMILSGAAAAAGIAWINSVGNLGGHFGPDLIGRVRDASGGDSTPAFLVLAGLALVGAAILLAIPVGRRRVADAGIAA